MSDVGSSYVAKGVVNASVLPLSAEGGPERTGVDDPEVPRLWSLPRDCFVAVVVEPYDISDMAYAVGLKTLPLRVDTGEQMVLGASARCITWGEGDLSMALAS